MFLAAGECLGWLPRLPCCVPDPESIPLKDTRRRTMQGRMPRADSRHAKQVSWTSSSGFLFGEDRREPPVARIATNQPRCPRVILIVRRIVPTRPEHENDDESNKKSDDAAADDGGLVEHQENDDKPGKKSDAPQDLSPVGEQQQGSYCGQ